MKYTDRGLSYAFHVCWVWQQDRRIQRAPAQGPKPQGPPNSPCVIFSSRFRHDWNLTVHCWVRWYKSINQSVNFLEWPSSDATARTTNVDYKGLPRPPLRPLSMEAPWAWRAQGPQARWDGSARQRRWYRWSKVDVGSNDTIVGRHLQSTIVLHRHFRVTLVALHHVSHRHQLCIDRHQCRAMTPNINPFIPTFFLTVAKMSLCQKRSAPYWSSPPFLVFFWHSGTLALSPERQSARMSKN